MTVELDADRLDLAKILRAGDMVAWGQGTSEPLTLSEAVVRQRANIGPMRVFLGAAYSDTVRPEHADLLAITSYGAIGTNARLARAGVLEVVPCPYSRIPDLLARGALRCDVALLQLSGPNANGKYSLGVANDYMVDAARSARVVIAEVNAQAPWTHDGNALDGTRIDFVVHTSRPLLEVGRTVCGPVEQRIGQHVASRIPDGAVLQTGIGAVPDAVLSSLHGHRDLGVHSGMIGDSVLDLIEAGVVSNRFKPVDRGVSVTGVLFGSPRLYRYADRNPEIMLRPARYTHDPATLAHFKAFFAINSALEVDLTGQVNAETSASGYTGAVGGQPDFIRAALASPDGRSIIALPSTAKSNTVSRIVPRLTGGIVTTPRCSADLVVTEWGVAELEGQPLRERVRRMIDIAHPAFREALDRGARELLQ